MSDLAKMVDIVDRLNTFTHPGNAYYVPPTLQNARLEMLGDQVALKWEAPPLEGHIEPRLFEYRLPADWLAASKAEIDWYIAALMPNEDEAREIERKNALLQEREDRARSVFYAALHDMQCEEEVRSP